MPLVNAKCPNCGANLQVDNTKDAAVCQYCGSAYIVEKAINNYNPVNNIHATVVNIYGGNNADFVVRGDVMDQQTQQYMPQYPQPPMYIPPARKPRRFLNGLSIFCLFGAGVMLLMSIFYDSVMLAGALVYGILGVMFLLLSKTPKGSTYLLGKEKGVKKSLFILICIFLLFATVIIFSGLSSWEVF